MFCKYCGKELQDSFNVCPYCGKSVVGTIEHNNLVKSDGSLLRRATLFLEDGDWENAILYFNKELDVNPEDAKAYIGLLLAKFNIKTEEELSTYHIRFDNDSLFTKALRFADEEYSKQLNDYSVRNIYNGAKSLLANGNKPEDFLQAYELFKSILDYQDASELADTAYLKYTECKNELIYTEAVRLFNSVSSTNVRSAKGKFESILTYKDSSEYVAKCDSKAIQIDKEKSKKMKRTIIVICACLAAVLILIISSVASQTKANKAKAQIIHDNMLGTSYYSKTEDDDGFYNNYTSNNLQPYEIYWLTTDETLYTFNKDGTVHYDGSYDMTALAYPKTMPKPSGAHNDYDMDYDEFSVYVSLSGNAYVSFSGTPKKTDYLLIVGEDNIPSSIKYTKSSGDYVFLEKQ